MKGWFPRPAGLVCLAPMAKRSWAQEGAESLAPRCRSPTAYTGRITGLPRGARLPAGAASQQSAQRKSQKDDRDGL